MVNPFIQFGLVIVVVLGVSVLMRILKQPLILGYILSGIIVGPFFLNLVKEGGAIVLFSEMGIAFLLFIVGLHLSPKVIKEIGKVSLIAGIFQIIFTVSLAYLIGLILGYSNLVSLYIAVAITFSSTIIVMKLLSDKDDLDKLYGKVSMGLALVQNFIAIVILIVIASLTTMGEGGLMDIVIKGFLVLVALSLFSYFCLPRITNFFAKSQEFLFLFAIGWGLGVSILFIYAGFSIEMGALIAGIMLSMSPYGREISSKLVPLRDFFIISFFIILGSQLIFTNSYDFILPVVLFSALILIGNPLSVMIVMGLLGYSKRTGFMSGLTVAQISEFSLILIALGVRTGSLSQEILSLVTLIALVTIAGSTYFIIYSDKLYSKIAKPLSIFEKNKIKEEVKASKDYEYYLLGENRIGFSIMKSFVKNKKDYLVIDFNPERVKRLKKKGISCIYGDISNSEFLEQIKLKKAKLVVSTIPDLEDNLRLIDTLRKKNKDIIIIVTARQISETFRLYEFGADYVILPHFLGGEYTANLIEQVGTNKRGYEIEKQRQLDELNERLSEGQEHPKKDIER